MIPCKSLNIHRTSMEWLAILQMGDRPATAGFNTKSWSNDLDELGVPPFDSGNLDIVAVTLFLFHDYPHNPTNSQFVLLKSHMHLGKL